MALLRDTKQKVVEVRVRVRGRVRFGLRAGVGVVGVVEVRVVIGLDAMLPCRARSHM